MSKLIDKFFKSMNDSRKQDSNPWRPLVEPLALEKIVLRYSDKEFKSIFSNKLWSGYPSYTHTRTGGNSLGPNLAQLMSIIQYHNPPAFDVALKYSTGLIHCFSLDLSSGKERLSSARRGRKSSDKRVRLRASKILPVNEIKILKNDSYEPIRNSVIKRVGIDNCYLNYLNDPNLWIRWSATACAGKDEIDHKSFLASNPHISVAMKILSKLSGKELLYLLDLPDDYGDNDFAKRKIQSVLSSRLSNHKNNI